MLELYENIKKKRIEQNISQQELAERVGYRGKSMISQVENGLIDLPQSMILKFADALNCSALELMGWEDGWAGEEKDETAPVFKVSDREPVVLADDERGLIFMLRALDQKRRDTIMRLIDFLIKEVENGNS